VHVFSPLQYLKLARELSGYGDIVFPHCACDSRKEGHVVPAVGTAAFKLHASKEDGTLESQVVEFQWNTIARWEVDEDGMAFCFQYTRQDNRPPRWLKVFTPYVSMILAANCPVIDPFSRNKPARVMRRDTFVVMLLLAVYVPLGLLRSDSRGSEMG